MKIKQRTKFRSFRCKEITRKTIAATIVFIFALTICVIPSTAKPKNTNKANNRANRSVKPLQQSEKDLNDPKLDTLTLTNRNVGDFKKGFIGDEVSAVSNSPFYKLDVIAKQGTQGITNIFVGSTVNSNGLVSFGGRTAAGYAFYVGDTENSPRVVAPLAPSPLYDGANQITENAKAIVLTRSISAQPTAVLTLRDTNPPTSSTLIATDGVGISDSFDSIFSFPTINRFDQPVFSAIRQNQLRLVAGFRFGYTFLKTYAAGLGGPLRPMIADNGAVVAREIEAGNVQRIILFNYGPNNFQTIADETRFNNLGASPGISDDGNIVVFQGDLKPDGSANYNDFYQTTSGIGIFASIDLGNGTRKLLRIAGTQSEDLSATGGNKDGLCEKNEVCIKDELGYDGTSLINSGNPIRFDNYDILTRVGVARQELGNPGLLDDSFVVTFGATPSGASPSGLFSNQSGLWTIRTDIKSLPDGTLDYIVAKAKPVIQINDTIDGSTIQQIGFHDPISNAANDDLGAARSAKRGDHRVAFWAQTNNGPMIVRGTYFDTDEDGLPDHWEDAGVTIGGQFINLPEMGSSSRHKDIFVQVNWLDPNAGIIFKPRAAALQRVIDSFKNSPVTNPDGVNGVNIHIDAGAGSIMNPRNSKKWGALSRAGSFLYTPSFGSSYPGVVYPGTTSTIYDWKDFDLFKTLTAPSGQTQTFFQTGRAAIFRLALFVDTWDNTSFSGKARSIPATDFIISLGRRMLPQDRGTIAQGSTFMHELGHSLGLKHGGNDDVRWKPNYISVMNYSFQFGGLIKADNSAEIDYSRNTLATLNENNLDESIGINDPNHRTLWYRPGSCIQVKSTRTDIDWNINNIFNETGVSVDLNGDNPSGCDPAGSVSILKGHEDWSVLNYNANGALGGNGAGSSGNPSLNLSSERTIPQIIAATPPDLLTRQGCEPVDEVALTISGSQSPVSVSFDGSASTAPCGNIVSYTWNFGDGTAGSGAQTSHIYTTQGTYFASLSLTDSNGNTTLLPSRYQITVTNNYSISGQVKDANGNGLSGVTVNLSGGQTASVQTDSGGNYTFANVISGNVYTVTPVKEGFRFNPSNRTFSNLSASQTANFQAIQGSLPSSNKRADFDGDGKTDLSVFRPSDGKWYFLNRFTGNTQSTAWGTSSDKPVPGDYDGDGKTDFAVFRPSDSVWYILQSSTNTFFAVQWGISTDVPVAGDYDGDGKTDVAVWRSSNGAWYVRKSSDGALLLATFGQNGDIPIVGDFDGDRKADFAFFRPNSNPSTSNWHVLQSTGGTFIRQFGLYDDKLVPADYDGNGTTDFGVWRPSTGFWYTAPSSELDPSHNFTAIAFGQSNDVPVPGDYNGDGVYDRAVFRNGAWIIQDLLTNTSSSQNFGFGTDKPIPNTYFPQ